MEIINKTIKHRVGSVPIKRKNVLTRFVFLILHYITQDDTEKCIESILENTKGKDVKIVVVDNGSPNKSGIKLKKKYENNSDIHFILSKDNLGFSKGNNLGFKYSKEKLGADFIIMINNDTCIIQNNFLDRIQTEYNYSNFALLGPKIILKDNKINKVYGSIPPITTLKREVLNAKIELITSKLYIYDIYIILRKILKKMFTLLNNSSKIESKYNENQRYENIKLHGCALIFSPNYIKEYDGIDDKTFLYREEELLFLRIIKNNLKSIYNPEIIIFHNEDSSTNAITKTKRKKRIFFNKNFIKSTKILIKEIEKYEK